MNVALTMSFDPGVTLEEQENITQILKDELWDCGVISVEQPSGKAAPVGSKGEPMSSFGTLLVTLAGSGSILGTVISTIANSFSAKRGTITARIGEDEISIPNPSEDVKNKLVKAWIESNTRGK